jgi:hypothetical protein
MLTKWSPHSFFLELGVAVLVGLGTTRLGTGIGLNLGVGVEVEIGSVHLDGRPRLEQLPVPTL